MCRCVVFRNQSRGLLWFTVFKLSLHSGVSHCWNCVHICGHRIIQTMFTFAYSRYVRVCIIKWFKHMPSLSPCMGIEVLACMRSQSRVHVCGKQHTHMCVYMSACWVTSRVFARRIPVACLPVACLPVACLPVACLPVACLPVACLPVACLPVACIYIVDGQHLVRT